MVRRGYANVSLQQIQLVKALQKSLLPLLKDFKAVSHIMYLLKVFLLYISFLGLSEYHNTIVIYSLTGRLEVQNEGILRVMLSTFWLSPGILGMSCLAAV
jgi:hypothetical protein